MMNKLIFTSCGLHHTQILVQSVLDTGRVEIAGHQAIVWCKVLGGFISAVAQHESVVCRTANNVAVIKCYLKKTLIMSCYTRITPLTNDYASIAINGIHMKDLIGVQFRQFSERLNGTIQELNLGVPGKAAPVPLPVHQRVAEGEILGHAGDSVVNGCLAVGVVFLQHLADDTGAFAIGDVVPQA